MIMLRLKRAAVVLLLFSVLLLCAACSSAEPEQYPKLIYQSSKYYADPNNQELCLGASYALSHNHPYDVVETDYGYDIVLHIVKVFGEERPA